MFMRGDSRISITISRNDNTAKLDRQDRFLVDDPKSGHLLAYTLSKPLKLGMWYEVDGDGGVYKFVLQEVDTTDDDNQELRIADYYKHFRVNKPDTINPYENKTDKGKAVWL